MDIHNELRLLFIHRLSHTDSNCSPTNFNNLPATSLAHHAGLFSLLLPSHITYPGLITLLFSLTLLFFIYIPPCFNNLLTAALLSNNLATDTSTIEYPETRSIGSEQEGIYSAILTIKFQSSSAALMASFKPSSLCTNWVTSSTCLICVLLVTYRVCSFDLLRFLSHPHSEMLESLRSVSHQRPELRRSIYKVITSKELARLLNLLISRILSHHFLIREEMLACKPLLRYEESSELTMFHLNLRLHKLDNIRPPFLKCMFCSK